MMVDQSTHNDHAPELKSLRWIPALVLIAGIFLLPYLPYAFEAPSIPIFMVAFFGPGAFGVLALLWWIGLSRATLREKLFGAIAVVVISVVGALLLDPSMQSITWMTRVFPTSLACFALGAIAFSRNPARLKVGIVAMVLCLAFWCSLQLKGTTGRFVSQYDWRWNATSEERYLQSADRRPSSSSDVKAQPLNIADSPWPAFRGRDRSGVLAQVSLPNDWKTQPPKVLWKRLIGPAWSSFTVADKRLFSQEQRGEKEAVICLNADTGEEIWNFDYPDRFWEAIAGAGPRATPTLAEEGLFALGANGMLVCLDPATGEQKWNADLKKDGNRTPPQWGFSASPLVVAGLVIVHAGGAGDKGILAYDAKTGELRWGAASGDHSYSSAQLATFFDVQGILMESNEGLSFHSIADGSVLWNHEAKVLNYRALQPLVDGNQVYLAATLGEGVQLLQVSKNQDQWKVEVLWHTRDLKPDFNDFIKQGDYLYGFDSNIFSCIDAKTGKRQWKKGRYGNGQVLSLPASEQLLVISESGELVLLHASPKGLEELAKIPAIEGKTWNHPIVIGNRIYVRNGEEAACFSWE